MNNLIERNRKTFFENALKIIRENSEKDLTYDVFGKEDSRTLNEVISKINGDDLYKSSMFRLIASAHFTGNDYERIKTEDLALMPDKEILDIFKQSKLMNYVSNRAYIGFKDEKPCDSVDNKELLYMDEYNYGSIKNYVYEGYYEHARKYDPQNEFNKVIINGKRYTPLIASFIENNKLDELVNGIYFDTHTQNGRPDSFGSIQAPNRKNVNIHMTTMLLERLTGEHYPLSVTKSMIDSFEITPVSHYDSEHYKTTIAEDNVREFKETLKAEKGMPKILMSNLDLVKELLPKLSTKERLGVFNYSLDDLSRTVAAHNFYSDDSISYSAAHALTNSGRLKIAITSTQPYLDKLDTDYDPNSQKTAKQHKLEISKTVKTYEDGLTAELQLEIESDAFLYYESFESALMEPFNKNLDEFINRGDSFYISYDGIRKSQIEDLLKEIQDAFSKHIKDKPLIGDVIVIDIDEDNQDLYDDSVVNGTKYIVTDVCSNYDENPSLKLKGLNSRVGAMDTIVSRKMRLVKNLNNQYNM